MLTPAYIKNILYYYKTIEKEQLNKTINNLNRPTEYSGVRDHTNQY